MPRWQLVPEGGGAPSPLPDGVALLGRGADCEIRLSDDTISRQHAELTSDAAGIAVRDLGSSNGVRVNGVKVSHARLSVDDVVAFGAVAFRVRPSALSARPPVRPSALSAPSALSHDRLSRLVELARRLSGAIEVEQLLAMVVEQAAELLPADRVALLLLEDDAASEAEELRPVHWRSRIGSAPVLVPRSIVRSAVSEKVPLTTASAFDDTRFQSASVVQTRVRAAVCVPLLADEDRVLGVLYLDSLTRSTAFEEHDVALCFAYAGLAAAGIAKAYFAESARREAIARANFERFFAPGVAARIAAQRSGARPGGERRPVTVLYSDVRDYTGLAESLPPETVAEQLSEYFAALVELVFEHGGTLDKFIGDALLALWGAPLPLADAPDRALAAARAMQAELRVLNDRWSAAEPQRPRLGIGIGLHHGEAFTGTIGSPRRLEYTVIGDVVNVAARLCETARPGEIVLSEALHQSLREKPAAAVAAALLLRGRAASVAAYRLAAVNGEP